MNKPPNSFGKLNHRCKIKLTMRRRQKRHTLIIRRPPQWLKFSLITAAGLLVAVSAYLIWPSRLHDASQSALPQAKTTPVAVGVTSRVMFTGDVYWGRSIYKSAQASSLGSAYPFSGLSGFNRQNYNAWIGNLECPTVPGVQPTDHQEMDLLQFNCNPSFLPELAKWFTAVSLANNHTDNQGGMTGLTATRDQLNKVGLQYFGSFDPTVLKDVCEVISLPVTVKLSDGTTKSGALPLAMCGYHGVFQVPPASSLAVMQTYSRYMPVIAMPHMGVEYQPHSDELRQNLYREMIDNGADAVLANHPHWVQNSESYKGKLIVYSMGNFIFDQYRDSEQTRSAVINLTLSGDQLDSSQLDAWLKLGATCSGFQDNCLEEAEDQQLPKLDLRLTFGITGTDSSSRVTKPAGPAVMAGIADRLDWNQTAAQLEPAGIPYQ